MNEKCPIRNNIRRLRFDRSEMTQQELADSAGVTRQTIIAIEGGRYNPSLLIAFRISRVFGVRVDEVFNFADEEVSPNG
jgi:putative transcriptional regulator